VAGLMGNAKKNSVSLEKYKHVKTVTIPNIKTTISPVARIMETNSLCNEKAANELPIK
jgi:hypothetical protein